MAENDEEDKLIAVARQIAKTVGRSDSMTNEILQILSTFDDRFSRVKISHKINEHDDDEDEDDTTFKSLDREISHYLSLNHPIWSDSSQSTAFLHAIDDLLATIKNLDHIPAVLDRADDLLQQSMFRLEDEFRLLTERSDKNEADVNFYFDSDDNEDDRIPVAHPLSDFDIIIDAFPSRIISDLHEIAKRMVGAGFEKECVYVYSSCRREFLEESITRLGVQRLTVEEVQKMEWSEVEEEIERWIKGVNVALRILFPSERRNCDRIFFGLTSASELSFMEVCRGLTIQLLNFADTVVVGSLSPECLFKVLDVFETLRDLMPEFESNFSNKHCVVLWDEAATIWKRLGEAIRGIFIELENLIRQDSAKVEVPGGGLHPITRYVVNYLWAACGSKQTLEQVFEDNAACGSKQTLEQVFEDNGTEFRNPDGIDRSSSLSSSSPLSVQITWIMELLQSNLEAKSKIYKDAALSSIFLMNNGKYIVQKVKESELASLLGDDWIRKQTAKVRQCHVNYQRCSWSKVLAVLKLENRSLPPDIAAKNLQEKLKVFTQYFDEICQNQSSWVVVDEQLRMELRISVASNLSPAYRNFLVRFKNVLELGKHTDEYVKYNIEDIEARINELFQRNSVDGRG